jgi:uncharacterized membrane protein (DUF106 family)
VSLINRAFGATLDVLLAPFDALPPMVGLAVLALLTAVVVLQIFKATSNQRRLSDVKRAIHAALFELRLFSDDPRAIIRAQREILQHNARYLTLCLVPLLWTIVPLWFVVAQLEFRYGYDGLRVGEPVLLTVLLDEPEPTGWEPVAVARVSRAAAAPRPRAVLEGPEAIGIDTHAVWIPATNEVVWRLVPRAGGEHAVTVRIGNDRFTKTVTVSDGIGRRSPRRPRAGVLNELLYPAEPPLPADAAAAAILVDYPHRDITIFGWAMPWIAVFFALTIVFALLLRKPLRVVV